MGNYCIRYDLGVGLGDLVNIFFKNYKSVVLIFYCIMLDKGFKVDKYFMCWLDILFIGKCL